MNDETMLIVAIALCLLMVLLAVKVGFSAALGAFIMGSILAETTQAEHIEHLTKSVKDLFAAIFFVSVGMLIDPSILIDYTVPILIITLATVFGKFLSSGLGALISGQPLKTAVQTGMSLAQIGEFSFIIATLGLSLKVTSDFLYPIAVAVSAITTFTTPYLIKASEPFYNFLERTLPKKWVAGIQRYSSSTAGITTLSDWKILLRAYTTNTVIHSVILIALVFFGSKYIQPFITEHIINGDRGIIISLILTLILMAPFVWALSIRRMQRNAYSHLWLNKKYTRGPLIALEVLRIGLGTFFVAFLIFQFYDTFVATLIAMAIIIAGIFVFSRKLQSFYDRLENRFLGNLNARQAQHAPEILPWDTHLTELVVSPDSVLVGQTLIDLAVREKYGINIALIERGKRMIPTPSRDERLYPHDKVLIIGSDDQLATVKPLFEGQGDANEAYDFPKNEMTLQKVVINSQSPIYKQSIRDSGIREKSQGLVVGIERKGIRILNPDSNLVFENEDIVWIVGNHKKIPELLK